MFARTNHPTAPEDTPIPAEILDRYSAAQVSQVKRIAAAIDVDFGGLTLRTYSPKCRHTAIGVALYYTGREPEIALSAVLYCPHCGTMPGRLALILPAI